MGCQTPKITCEPWAMTDKKPFNIPPIKSSTETMTSVPKITLPLNSSDALNGPVMYMTYLLVSNPSPTDGEMPARN